MHNNIYCNLISLGAILCVLFIFSFILSKFEEIIRLKQNSKIKIYVPWSLKVFKIMRQISFALISLEYTFFPSVKFSYSLIGILLVFLGVVLRIVAIRTLGPMWSFHVALLDGHCIVNKGIYKYIKHPAYIGNMYLIGLALIFGAPFSSVVTLLFFLIFLIIRIPKEELLLSRLSKVIEKQWTFTTGPHH
jgi:isoprenylcysteine carboxyl methyltransferase (ICMT) family protein YpbQ